YTLGPVAFTGDALSSSQAALQNERQVNVSVKGDRRAQANEAFNACYQGVPTCPATDSTGGSGAIAIVLDGAVISPPTVRGPDLASEQCPISGQFSEGDAKDLALVLR